MTPGRYRLTSADEHDATIGYEKTFDKACAVARAASLGGGRVEVSLNDRTGRVLAAYKNGREVFYTYAGGREF